MFAIQIYCICNKIFTIRLENDINLKSKMKKMKGKTKWDILGYFPDLESIHFGQITLP